MKKKNYNFIEEENNRNPYIANNIIIVFLYCS